MANCEQYFKKQFEINNKMISKLNFDLQKCDTQLTALKLMVTNLQMQMTAMQAIYRDTMELRKLIVILHPHLQ